MESFLNPSKVLKKIRLKEDMTAVDFGCGSGGWVIPLAKKLEDGKVYAVDILEEPLSALKAKAKLNKISNIETVLADVEKGTELINKSCHLVLATSLFFQVEDKKNVFKEIKRVLKEKGKLLVVDWEKDTSFGPEKRVSSQEIIKMAQEVDLKLEKEFKASPYHYGLVLGFTKKRPKSRIKQ